MALRGERFELDLDVDDFAINPVESVDIVRDIQEHSSTELPPAPKFKSAKSGFPEHKPRRHVSAFKQQQQAQRSTVDIQTIPLVQPSDRAIAHHVARTRGIDVKAKQKAEISDENRRRLADMSPADIEQARADLMKNLSPAFIERLLRRANIEEDLEDEAGDAKPQPSSTRQITTATATASLHHTPTATTTVHFPVPPRNPDDFVPLDPNSDGFLDDLRNHYFPEIPHDPSSLSWLQDPTSEEDEDSAYNPDKTSYTASSLRFGFTGRLIAPKASLEIEVSKGLHHHGEAPSSAGYTIPELAILCRSTLPNQRCLAYQMLGRILYRLGHGDWGGRGSELAEALWQTVERERVVELMLAEANRDGKHVSARAYATEALWVWRKGGGGDRGLLKPTEKIAT